MGARRDSGRMGRGGWVGDAAEERILPIATWQTAQCVNTTHDPHVGRACWFGCRGAHI